MVDQYPAVPDEIFSQTTGKSHTACDECRARKLKCSREPTGCSRCVADKIVCHYKPRKRMGRPRKRRRDVQTLEINSAHGGSDTGPRVQQLSEDIAFPDILDLQLPPTRFSPMGPIQEDVLNIDSSGTNDGPLGYPVGEQSILGANDFSVDALNFDFLSDTAYDVTDLQGWITASAQSRTPRATVDDYPAIQSPSQTDAPSCSCLPDLYKTLRSFPSSSSPSFPSTLWFLKQTTDKSRAVVQCDVCPRAYQTALQNSMILCTLIHLVLNEYTRLLKHIDERAETEDKIVLRMGEHHGPEKVHLHTGTIDCPMGISVDLCGAEWRILARKAVRKEVMGNGADYNCLTSVLDAMRDRQIRWHHSFSHEHEHDVTSDGNSAKARNECICAQVLHIDQLKRLKNDLGL
ncbi:MAG: hypothetical protein Q9163_001619 [Psora crenata]